MRSPLSLALLPVFLAAALAAYGQPLEPGPAAAPETSVLRQAYWESFFNAPKDRALARKPFVVRTENGAFRFSSSKEGSFFYLNLSAAAPESVRQALKQQGMAGTGSEAAAKGPAAESADAANFPLWTQGSWIIKRSLTNGAFIQAKVFLRSDPGLFIRLYPDGDRSRMDVLVYGGVIHERVAIPLPFERLLRSSLADIVDWTRGSVDWTLFEPHPELSSESAALAGRIRQALPGLHYVDDGGLDAQGRAVFIATLAPQASSPAQGSAAAKSAAPGLNCSGFAQWVADGIYHPLTGKWLDAAKLKERRIELRSESFDETVEVKYDPYFGLDWTRNIAKALADASMPTRAHSYTESDMTTPPFALFEPANQSSAPLALPRYQTYPAYDGNVGYAVQGLKALLYLSAVREPGNFYFASLNKVDKTRLRRYYHVAVLIPYFDKSGAFHAAVFESCVETDIDSFIKRNPLNFIHLEKARVERDFDAPQF